MSIENVKKFYEDVKKDEGLKASVVVAVADKMGYHFSEADLKTYLSNNELGDDALGSVAGGGVIREVGKLAKSLW